MTEAQDDGPLPIEEEARQAAANGGSVPQEQPETDPPAEEEDSDPTGDAPETAKSYQVDVQRALQRETQDGKGDEDPGPSDWQGYATEGVEVEQEEGQ